MTVEEQACICMVVMHCLLGLTRDGAYPSLGVYFASMTVPIPQHRAQALRRV